MTAPRLAAALALTTALTAPAARAQDDAMGWLTLLSPDRVVASLLQSGLAALRSQADLTWDATQVDLRRGTIGVSGVVAFPFFDWDENGDCRVEIERFTIQSLDPFALTRLQARLRLSGVTADLACLPPPARIAPQMAGLSDVSVPLLSLDLNYDMPSAGADMTLFAQIDGAVTAELSAAFDYLWAEQNVDEDGTTGEPVPVAFLEHATLTLENLGAWDAAARMLPPPFTDPATGGDALAQAVQAGLAQMAEGSPPDAVTAFTDSVSQAWSDFLADPTQIAIETGFDPADPVFLEVAEYEDSPLPLIADLQPRLVTRPRDQRAALPPELLARAIDDPAALPADEAKAVATALITGSGAPLNPALGADLLGRAAADGDTEAAALLAAALADTDPAAAYGAALAAAADGVQGAAATLDAIETDLDLAQILAAQPETADLPDGAAPAQTRAAAMAAMSGRGTPRSYAVALTLAYLGQANGDSVSADLAAELETRFATTDPEAWARLSAMASERATEIWLADLVPAQTAPGGDAPPE